MDMGLRQVGLGRERQQRNEKEQPRSHKTGRLARAGRCSERLSHRLHNTPMRRNSKAKIARFRINDPDSFVTGEVFIISARMRRPDRKAERKPDRDRKHFYKPPPVKPEGGLWLYGLHAVRGALSNPKRFVRRVVLTERAAEEIGPKLLGRVRHAVSDLHAISRILPDGAVHQG